MGVRARAEFLIRHRMNLPKPLPTSAKNWSALYAWLNQLRACVLSITPLSSSTVQQDRTSKGTILRVQVGETQQVKGGGSDTWAA